MKLSVNKISDLTGQDRRRVKRIAEAALTPEVQGRSHLYETCELIPLLFDSSGYEQHLDLTQERAWLAKVQRERAEIELQKARGDVVDVNEITEAMAAAIGAARAQLLGLPHKLAPQLVAITDPGEAFNLLQATVHDALTELADGPVVGEQAQDDPQAAA
jgi:phage terminase Nu1 subunit (DNA packaging protein)